MLEREGWDTAVQEAEDVWLVVAGCLRVLSEPLVREIRARLASLAAAHGGTYDGWEAGALVGGQAPGCSASSGESGPLPDSGAANPGGAQPDSSAGHRRLERDHLRSALVVAAGA